jgi:hypothetical protein
MRDHKNGPLPRGRKAYVERACVSRSNANGALDRSAPFRNIERDSHFAEFAGGYIGRVVAASGLQIGCAEFPGTSKPDERIHYLAQSRGSLAVKNGWFQIEADWRF